MHGTCLCSMLFSIRDWVVDKLGHGRRMMCIIHVVQLGRMKCPWETVLGTEHHSKLLLCSIFSLEVLQTTASYALIIGYVSVCMLCFIANVITTCSASMQASYQTKTCFIFYFIYIIFHNIIYSCQAARSVTVLQI